MVLGTFHLTHSLTLTLTHSLRAGFVSADPAGLFFPSVLSASPSCDSQTPSSVLMAQES